MERIEFKAKRERLVLMLAGSVVFCVIGLTMIIWPDLVRIYPRPLTIGSGVAGLAFFGLCAYGIAKQIFDPEPQLVLSDEGIQIKGMKAPIPWGSIESATVVKVQRQTFVALRLTDEQERVSALSPAVRSLAKLNGALGFGPFNVSVTALGVSAETIHRLILERVERS